MVIRSLLSFLKNKLFPIRVKGKGNIVKIPSSYRTKYASNNQIIINGDNNQVLFADDVQLTNTTIIMNGNNNRLVVDSKTRFYGPCRVNMQNGAEIRIGENCGIRGVSFECNQAKIILGNLVMFSYGILLRNHDSHRVLSMDKSTVLNHPKDIVLGSHVWVCERVTVMKGVNVGNDSILALGALVTKDVPSNSVVAGVPAKVTKTDITWDY